MSSEETVEPEVESAPSSYGNISVVTCSSCTNETAKSSAVGVVAGRVIGTWEEGPETPPHVSLTSFDGGSIPSIQPWCGVCAKRDFGIDVDDVDADISEYEANTRPVLTARTVSAFVAGIALQSLIFVLLFLV